VSVQTRITDILAFRDTPGFAYLLLAANPDVSIRVLMDVLDAIGDHQSHPEKWMRERREFFRVPTMPRDANPRAVAFIQSHMGEPSWRLSKQLRQQGIKCSAQRVHRIWMAIRYLSLRE